MIRVLVVLVVLTCAVPAAARDFAVEFLAENYQETQTAYSHIPEIYHSIQVNSHAGPKLLVLTGSDLTYRKWLRHYIAENKGFIIRVPEDEVDLFISSRVYDVDVTRIHPYTPDPGGDMAPDQGRNSDLVTGDRHILVVDADVTRARLVAEVIRNLGYTPTITRNGENALNLFRAQPERFKMIIAHHDTPGMGTVDLVTQILKISHLIPVLVETGYRDEATRKQFESRFSGAGSVTFTPMILRDLNRTIRSLVPEEMTDSEKEKG